MTRSDHREPIKFVGMYFIDEHGEDYRTGQIIAQIDDVLECTICGSGT